MTHDQFSSICVEVCHRIDERLRILDTSGDNPSRADLERFRDTVRECVSACTAARDKYMEGGNKT